ncbi:hypothetical protein MKZ38_006281 [Zalerion maritima]|uniref:Transcription initiation factor IIA large subunit n=1 Tax=Zalerion maritima TaxID=339359 RepID=A0AAD5WQE0_9PEZI|nr:hypothetical protein MKZ38_006281 [Zalerion maritima]
MSNQQVGNVYQQIIEEVINASRSDFEDQGVEDSILMDLRKGWQHKLTSLRIADFPWDPKPEPQTNPTLPAPQQQQAVVQQQQQQQQQAQQAQQAQQPANQYTQTQLLPQSTQAQHGFALPSTPVSNGGGPQVKQEPSAGGPSDAVLEHPPIKQEPGSTTPVPVPQARAIENLRNKYGDHAAGTINKIQEINHPGGGNFTHPPGQQQQGQQQRPGAPQQPHQQAQYHHALTLQMQQQMGGPNSMRQHQNDGTSSYPDLTGSEGVLMRDGKELGRVEVDGLLHSHIAAAGREMEGGGLMMSLKPAPKGTLKARKQELKGFGGPLPTASAVTPSTSSAANPGRDQVDGPMDEDDDELINSDLDDSADDKDSDDDDDEGGNVMLCVYDKVQRVKNKWKCTLKDGVLTVNSREYVFHKAQGEFEW